MRDSIGGGVVEAPFKVGKQHQRHSTIVEQPQRAKVDLSRMSPMGASVGAKHRR